MSRSEELFEYFKSHIGKGYPDYYTTYGKWLNPIVREVEKDRLVLEFLGREEQGNPAGLIHGGVVSSWIDETIGAMMFYVGEPHFKKSVSLSIDFLSGCRPGDTLLVEAKLIKSGRTLSYGEAIITRKDDSKLIAIGKCNLVTSVHKL
ncbi:MAG: PaaI family thioesterase [Bacteroidia bacterium]